MKVFLDNRNDDFIYYEGMEEDLENAVKTVLKEENMSLNYEVSISFVDEKEIQELNRDYRNTDSVTDVLSFPLYERKDIEYLQGKKLDGDIMLGDVIICVEVAQRQAKEFLHSFRRELSYLTVHSMFHLLGYDHIDSDDQIIMRKKEKNVMRKLNIFKSAEYFNEKHKDIKSEGDPDLKKKELKEMEMRAELKKLRIENDRLTKIVQESKMEEQSDLDQSINIGEYNKEQEGPKNKDFYGSMKYAVDGILFAIKNERNVKIDLIIALLILVVSLFFNFSKLEMAILALTMIFVIVMELFNTALENAVDIFSDTKYHKLAKLAKDISAGAVLITAIGAIFVAYLLFYDRIFLLGNSVFSKVNKSNAHKLAIALGLVLIVVVVLKAIFYRGRGTPLKGGSVSGHAALGFCLATIGSYLAKEPFVTLIFYFLAILIAQSRIEARIHSIGEVILGGLLGIFISAFVFAIF